MSCKCSKPEKPGDWTPIPDFLSPTEILPGENIECYAQRAGVQAMNDAAETIENKIDNTSLVTDLNGSIDEQLKLTSNSNKTVTRWKMQVDGSDLTDQLGSGVTFNTNTGRLTGQVAADKLGKAYKLLVIAFAGSEEIDSREFNFTPKKGSKDDTVKFVFPYSGAGGRVTCRFGPRKPPAPGASSMHKGIDISAPGAVVGQILAAGDGTVVKCGPARGYGNWVVIEHKNASGKLIATTVYGHMNEIYVSVGQKVSAGQKIAKEGNAGIGSAAHLHFELHKGSFGNPTDPLPYLNGSFSVAENNLPGKQGEPDESSFKNKSNSNTGMTSDETNANSSCPLVLKNQATNEAVVPDSSTTTAGVSIDVKAEIERALNEDSSLTADDKKYLLFLAKIESSFNPKAKNSSTSATGLYQMVDATARYTYKKIGSEPTIENRMDPYLATKAQIFYYKNDQLKYYNEFKSKQTIAGKQLKPEDVARYQTYKKEEFAYVLHHDGVGSMVKGKDLQGLDYFRKKTA